MSHLDTGVRSLTGSERWFLVRTRPKCEQKAAWNLQAQSFRIFLPQILKTVRHARRLSTVRAPLFPGYLFIVLDLGRDRWLSVGSTIGVMHLFAHKNGRPVPVPAGVVEALIDRSDGSVARLDFDLVKGQRVRILAGPFADLMGTLQRLDEAGRVQVLLQMMGTAVPVTLHRSALAPAA